MTPHIEAKKGEIAKIVLMPGDPLRAKFIADTYLKNVKLVNTVRNMFMYTGEYNGKKISVAGSGMGQPSIGIYSYELFKFYDVDSIIRIGSAGSFTKDLDLFDIVLATEAYSDSNSFAKLVLGTEDYLIKPSQELNNQIIESAKKLNKKITTGRIYSSDVFYSSRKLDDTIKQTKALAVEMESYALFVNAQKLNKKAACLLTISDSLITKRETSSKERQEAFSEMMEIALNI